MSVTHIASESSDSTGLDQSIIDEFKTGLHGTVFQAHDAGYDDARTIWNVMIDRRPGLIVRCAGVADVIAAVNLARSHNLLVSVRCGGHNVSGNAVCDGGLMIDLSAMKSIHVDQAARTARAEGGATWKEYDRETQVFGLASTGGTVSRTGICCRFRSARHRRARCSHRPPQASRGPQPPAPTLRSPHVHALPRRV